jgi:hypothetical protein
MHYPFNAFSKNGQSTLRPLKPLNGKKPYKQLSTLDAKQTNIMYDYCRKTPGKGWLVGLINSIYLLVISWFSMEYGRIFHTKNTLFGIQRMKGDLLAFVKPFS